MTPKFRAWHKKSKEMFKVTSIDFDNRKIETETSADGKFWIPFKDITLLQSTGLKDKNGKEIFEGDIVKDEDGEWIAQIIWNDTWAMFEPEIMWQEDKNCSYDIRMGRPERFEVIGNIHENPELLKEKP